MVLTAVMMVVAVIMVVVVIVEVMVCMCVIYVFYICLAVMLKANVYSHASMVAITEQHDPPHAYNGHAVATIHQHI